MGVDADSDADVDAVAGVAMLGAPPELDCPAHKEDRKVAVGCELMWAWRRIGSSAISGVADVAYTPLLPRPQVLPQAC